MLIIALGVYGGYKLDLYLDWGFPLFIILLSLIATIIAIYISVKDIIHFNKNNSKKK